MTGAVVVVLLDVHGGAAHVLDIGDMAVLAGVGPRDGPGGRRRIHPVPTGSRIGTPANRVVVERHGEPVARRERPSDERHTFAVVLAPLVLRGVLRDVPQGCGVVVASIVVRRRGNVHSDDREPASLPGRLGLQGTAFDEEAVAVGEGDDQRGLLDGPGLRSVLAPDGEGPPAARRISGHAPAEGRLAPFACGDFRKTRGSCLDADLEDTRRPWARPDLDAQVAGRGLDRDPEWEGPVPGLRSRGGGEEQGGKQRKQSEAELTHRLRNGAARPKLVR